MDNNVLIDNIRTLCKKNKISISRLESDLFLSPGLISRWNKNTPSLDRIMDIANYFGVSLDELVSHSADKIDRVERLITALESRSKVNEISWDALDMQNPPKDLKGISPRSFFPIGKCDCYYTCFDGGYIFLASTHIFGNDLQLALFAQPDVYSPVGTLSNNTTALMPLYEFLSSRHKDSLNQIKLKNFVDDFLRSSAANDEVSSNDKITPLKGRSEASNF